MSKTETVLETEIRAGVLQTTLDIQQAIVDGARIHLSADGLASTFVDPANVAMMDMALDAGIFEQVPSGQITMGANLERLEDMLSKAGADDTVTLALNQETMKLSIRYGGVTGELALIDPDSIRTEPDMSGMELPNELTLKTAALADALGMADYVSDHIALVCDTDDGLIAAAEGDTDDVTVSLADDVSDGTVSEATRSLYSLEYLSDLVGVVPAEEVTVRLGQEMPLVMTYEYADGHGFVDARLAPRIENK